MAGASISVAEIRPSVRDNNMPEIIESASGPIETSAPSSAEFGSHESSNTDQARPQSASQREMAESEGSAPTDQLSPERKKESRYERTKRQRAEFNRRETALNQREEQLAQIERERNAPKKPSYSLADLKEYRQAWVQEAEEEWDESKKAKKQELVRKADAEIVRLEKLESDQVAASRKTVEFPVYGTPEHKARWEAGEQEIQKENPDFMKAGTPIDLMMRKIMQSPYGQAARGHPDGIWAVYSEAQKELLKGENQELKAELKRLTGLTSIGGGSPGRVGNGARVESIKDFAKLSSAEMAKHLRRTASRTELPWP